jgi:hypothetical protein
MACSGGKLAFMVKGYAVIDYRYAAILHEAYGTPVGKTFMLTTRYGLLSGPCGMRCHRRGVKVYAGRDYFEGF